MLSGILVIGVNIPLLKGRIPPNAIYGVRIKKSFESEANWYAINRYGAVWLMGYGAAFVLLGLLALALPLASHPLLIFAVAFAPLWLLIVPAVQILRYSRRF